MLTKSSSRFFIVVMLCMTMPIRQVFASMPEIRPLPMQQMDVTAPFSVNRSVDFSRVHFVEMDPVVLDSKVLDSLILETEEDVVLPGITTGTTFDNIEEELQDELLIPGQERTGINKKRIMIGVGLLLAVSLITALFAFLASGSGSGSGTGAGGGAGSGDGNPGGDPNAGTGEGGNGGNGGAPDGSGGDFFGAFGAAPPGGGSGDGDGTGDGSFSQLSLFSSLPLPYDDTAVPEPATMLLTLLGLGLPLIRKRFTK